jgi:hypothetical protein
LVVWFVDEDGTTRFKLCQGPFSSSRCILVKQTRHAFYTRR